MKKHLAILFSAFLLFSCGKDKKENEVTEPETKEAVLAFDTQHYEKKTDLPCKDNCPKVSIDVPQAEGVPVVADSINNKVFNTVRGIVFFGEKPYTATNYDELMASFLASYKELKTEFPNDALGWEATIKGSIEYKTDSILNIKLDNYTFTGGAHGYAGLRSLLFDPHTGKSLTNDAIFNDVKAFTAFAEKKFREKFNIPAGKSINSTGLMFKDEVYALPENIFYTQNGLLLYYNAYEVASYAEQQKELLIPYSEVSSFLKRR